MDISSHLGALLLGVKFNDLPAFLKLTVGDSCGETHLVVNVSRIFSVTAKSD